MGVRFYLYSYKSEPPTSTASTYLRMWNTFWRSATMQPRRSLVEWEVETAQTILIRRRP